MIIEITIGFIAGIIFTITIIKPQQKENGLISKINKTKKIWRSDK